MDPRQYGESVRKTPNDGPGPRGGGECYYTSRVLDSTARYVVFVRKLRAAEEEERKGRETQLQELKDKQCSNFFNRCDRRSLLNNVATRVDLCLASYQADLEKKKQRLISLLKNEEEANIRKFVEQAQAGAAAIWEDKKERLAFLLAKRKKEHEEKFKDTPLSKCVHVLPCIVKQRAKEIQDVQLYQIRENAAKRQAVKEFDKMWHAVTMKHSEALAARMEYDTIQKLHATLECKKSCERQIEQRRRDAEQERERLKRETLYFKSIWESENKKEEDAKQRLIEKSKTTALERKQAIADREEMLARAAVEAKRIADTWDRLAGQGADDQAAGVARRRTMERDLDSCNHEMAQLRDRMLASRAENDSLVHAVAAQEQERLDARRCGYLSWSKKTNRDVRAAMVEQIKDRQRAKEERRRQQLEEDHNNSEVIAQLNTLSRHKEAEDARARKQHERNLLQQIEYNQLLKDRALQEEKDQLRKFELARQEYDDEIKRMMSRPFFTEEQHPFMKQAVQGLKMKDKCPCSKPDYCAEPGAAS